MTRRLGPGATIAVVAIVLAACGSGTGTPAPATAGAPASAPASAVASDGATDGGAATTSCAVSGSGGTTATIEGFAFPTGLTVNAGEAITWTNADSAPHTVTFSDGTCDSGRIPAGGSVTVTYTVPGTFAFACMVHPNMTGTLEVKG